MPGHRPYRNSADLPAVIAVFPLTGVLLLPRTRLPLNVFEPRYLTMIDEAMSGGRLIGLIQPKTPGEDMAPHPPLSNVGCVGRIVEYSETEDGRYLITLLGIVRFRVSGEREVRTPFRQVAADYTPFAADFLSDDEPDIPRKRLTAALKPYLDQREMKTDWRAVLEAPAETLVNALTMLCPFEPAEKQALLEAPGLTERADILTALIEMANASSPAAGGKPIH
jgi:Lon protease-like protein